MYSLSVSPFLPSTPPPPLHSVRVRRSIFRRLEREQLYRLGDGRHSGIHVGVAQST